MKKRRIALPVAMAVAAGAAHAQSSNVQLYGRANLGLDNYSATGATAGSGADFSSRNRVFDNSSRVGLRGTEDLGNGLRAIFQIETGVNIDSGTGTGQSGAVNANANGAWASRDSFVGLDSTYGRVSFGRQSIYWANGTIIQHAANYVNTELPFLSGVILGRLAGPVARTGNVVQYTSPTFAGFNATASYAPNSESAQAGANTDARIWGLTARWAGGPFAAQVDWAQNEGAQPAAGQRPEVTGLKVLGGWKYMPGAQISALWLRVENKVGNAASGTIPGPQAGFSAAGDSLEQDGWALSWEHTFGNVQALAQYGELGNAKGCSVANGCSDTKSRSYMVGARYLLSKRTWLYATYNETRNDSNQITDYVAAGQTSAVNTGFLPGIGAGADPRIWALGVFHAF
jgi:predicted porin